MRSVRRIAAVLVGTVFFLAGILKLMDPVGASLVVTEYLRFLGLRFMTGTAWLTGPAIAFVETLLGAAMITGVWRRVVGILTGVVLGFFTLLTLALWILNPSMDCGCFGEAIHLTHLQSLIKNVVLLAFWALAYLPLRSLGEPKKVKYVSFSIVSVSVGLFLLYSSLSIPMLDFTDFKSGAELQQSPDVVLDKDAPLLSFCDAEGEYADEVAATGKVLVVSVYEPADLSHERASSISALLSGAEDLGINPLLLVSGTPESLEAMTGDPVLLMNAYFADRKDLMSLNRSNGGATYLSDGMIVAKWAVRALPDAEKLSSIADKDAVEASVDENTPSRLRMQAFLLYVFAIMLLL